MNFASREEAVEHGNNLTLRPGISKVSQPQQGRKLANKRFQAYVHLFILPLGGVSVCCENLV